MKVDRRRKDGQIDHSAPASLRTTLGNILNWRHALLISGQELPELVAPTAIYCFDLDSDDSMLKYQTMRRKLIMEDLSNARIGHYCRLYNIRIEGRSCPSYF